MVANLPKSPLFGSKKAGWYELVSNPRWYRMQSRFGAYFLFALVAAPMATASAGPLPDIKSTAGNAVPECVTPGRLLAFLKSRNAAFDSRFEALPSEYMRHGEALGVRWDYAFYQMLIETGNLTFRNGSRTVDVKPAQNNFAGIGATGKGEPGESFTDVSTGVRAHLEHLLLYSGQQLENPVADRTRKVQQWGVLSNWQAGFKKPITYADLAQKWAPGNTTYVKTLETLAQGFQDYCRRRDPQPELAAAVRKSRQQVASLPEPDRPDGRTLARRAIEDGKVEQNNRRLGLGAQEPTPPPANTGRTPPTPFKLLNTQPPAEDEDPPPARQQAQPAAPPAASNTGFRSSMLNTPSKPQPPAAPEPPPAAAPPATPPAASNTAQPPAARKEPNQRIAMAQPPPSTKPVAVADAVPPGQKCRVWTASYGGQKALIIRSIIDKVVNFTVLDVNEGAEKREAEAFIAAYAKNGAVTGEFNSQNVALDKAFELCPEG